MSTVDLGRLRAPTRAARRARRASRERAELPGTAARTWSAAAVLAATLVVALQFDRVFVPGASVLQPAVGAAVGAVVAWAVAVLRGSLRAVAIAAACGAVVAWAVVSAGGSLPDDLARAVVSGVSGAVSSNWPVPVLAPSVGAFTLLAAVAAAAGVELALHRRSVAALLPSAALLAVVAMTTATGGGPSWVSVALYCVAGVAVLRSLTPIETTGITRWFLLLALLVAAAVPAIVAPVLDADRFDPRDELPETDVETVAVTPLARLDEWRSLDPPVRMFTTTSAEPARWRLVGLTRYDGRTWLPADDYRLGGGRVADPLDGLAIGDVEVRIDAIDSLWIPFVDRTVSVSGEVRTDGASSGLLPVSPPVTGDTFSLQVQPVEVLPAQLAGVDAPPAEPALEDGYVIPDAIGELATVITVGGRTDLERATLLARHLADEYVLDPSTPPGHSSAELELFLLRTKRGGDEQFVAAYGLLAASIGLPVRIAVGFDTRVDPAGGGTVAPSDAARAWPEVDFGDLGWVAFDPVPTSVNAGDASSGDGAVAPTDDASVPPPTTSPPPPEDDDASDESVEAQTVERAAGPSGAAVVAIGGLSLLVLAVGGHLATVVLLKRRRRARRRRAAPPDAAVGAFVTGVDRVIDLGAEVRPSMTDLEVVAHLDRTVPGAVVLLAPSAEVATAAVFGVDEVDEAMAERSWHQVEEFEQATMSSIGPIRAMRARVSIRSLRRSLDR